MELPHTQCNDTLVQQIKDALVSEATLDKAENNLLTLDRNKIRSIAVIGPNAEHVELGAFGHGLSYTTFKYANVRVTPEKTGPHGTATVSVDVTNTGRIAGDEVVQMYISDEIGSVSRPVKELKGFTRIHLRPGETKNVQFSITPDKLSFLNEDLNRVVEPGMFTIMVGPSSRTDQLLTAKLEIIQR